MMRFACLSAIAGVFLFSQQPSYQEVQAAQSAAWQQCRGAGAIYAQKACVDRKMGDWLRARNGQQQQGAPNIPEVRPHPRAGRNLVKIVAHDLDLNMIRYYGEQRFSKWPGCTGVLRLYERTIRFDPTSDYQGGFQANRTLNMCRQLVDVPLSDIRDVKADKPCLKNIPGTPAGACLAGFVVTRQGGGVQFGPRLSQHAIKIRFNKAGSFGKARTMYFLVPEQSVNGIVAAIRNAMDGYPAALHREEQERAAAEKPITVLEPITIAQCDGTACKFTVSMLDRQDATCPATVKFDGYEFAVESSKGCIASQLLGMNTLELTQNSTRGEGWLVVRSPSSRLEFSIQDEAARMNFKAAFEEGKKFIAYEMKRFQEFLQIALQDQRAADVLRKIQQSPTRTEEGQARRWAELVEEAEQK